MWLAWIFLFLAIALIVFWLNGESPAKVVRNALEAFGEMAGLVGKTFGVLFLIVKWLLVGLLVLAVPVLLFLGVVKAIKWAWYF